jgi:hypothetical protein
MRLKDWTPATLRRAATPEPAAPELAAPELAAEPDVAAIPRERGRADEVVPRARHASRLAD